MEKNEEWTVEPLENGVKVIRGGQKPQSISEVNDNTTSLTLLNKRSLYEAAKFTRDEIREAHTTSEFPNALREDFRTISLSAYNAISDSMLPIFFRVDSRKQTETYAGINKLKATPGVRRENAPFWMLGTSEKTKVEITNDWHGGVVEITQDMIMFDKSNEIVRLAAELGESYKYERFQLLTDVLTTSANTTAASATVTLTPTNLETMITAYRKQSDSASAKILALNCDTLVVPAALEFTARRILESAGIPGSANNDINVLKGILNLVVNPLLDANSTTKFYIGKANNANGLIYQNVIGPEPEYLNQGKPGTEQISDDVFFYNLIRYKAQGHYGMDIVDIRLWHRSTT